MGRKHSPEGEKYKTLGEGTYEAGRIKKLSLRRQVKDLSKPETKAQKEAGTRIPSSHKNKPLSSTEWHKREDRSVSQNSLRAYRGYVRNFGR